MIKRKLKQIFIIFLTTLTCTMGICSTVAGANNQEIVEEYVVIEDGIEKHVTVTETGVADIEADFGLGELLDGLVGVVFWVVKLIPMTIARLFMSLVSVAINGTEGFVSGFTLDKVLFNEIPLLQVNFFQMPEADAFNSEMITSLRKNVSIWYVSIRNLAAVILAIMALYVGIRMAISSVAEEKAKYKKMLVDWVVSLGLLFVLHYIMVFVVEINDSIVEVLRNIRDNTITGDNGSLMDTIWENSFSTISLIEQLSYMFIYCTLAVMTFIFFITYVKRMITIAFLIMIAPIITITYSIDRMGDGKSQALNKWFKEYIYNILLQPFQCIIYLALVNSAIASLAEEVTLASGLIAGLMIVFMYQAENIIKEIFHFESKSVASTIAQTALVTSAIGLIGSGAKKVGKASSSGGGRKKTQPKQKDPAAGGGSNAGAGSGANGGSGSGGSSNAGAGTGSGGSSNAGAGSRNETGRNSGTGSSSSSNAGVDTGSDEKSGRLKSLGNKAGRAILGAAKGSAKLTLGMMMMSAGAATGNLTNAINGFKSGSGIAEDFINSREEKWHASDVATDYQRAMDSGLYAGKSDAEIRQRTKDLLEGEAEPVSDKERKYYSAMVATKDYYKDRGYSEDEAISRIDEDIAGFQSGALGEATIERTAYNIAKNTKNKIKEARRAKRNGSSGEDNKFSE